jgi:ribonuclease HII
LRQNQKKRALPSPDEVERTLGLYQAQLQLPPDAVVVGIDEVGRGAVAGPLTVAAVALPRHPQIYGLDDSKKLKPEVREALAAEIHAKAAHIGLAHVEPAVIDRVGMSKALRQAMLAALQSCGAEPDAVLIDGRPVNIHPKERCIVKGDGKVACIAAASIVAKVARDALMADLDASCPGYGFAQHKGYATERHVELIRKLGLSRHHRVTFCAHFLQESLF